MKTYARDVSARLAAPNPKKFLIKSTKAARRGKIFIDWMRNGRGSTCVAPWSLRARPGATLSMPITWEALAALPPEGFNIQDLTHSPSEWTKPKAQNVGFKLL